MRKRIPVFMLLALVALCDARPVAFWTYEKLAKEADLIVIATPTKTEDSGERVSFPGIARGENQPVPALGVNTTFAVLAVLKGDRELSSMVLFHLREAEPQAVALNAPMLVAFAPEAKRRYLLFLKREADGRFSPLAGQTDPAFAVKDLGTYP